MIPIHPIPDPLLEGAHEVCNRCGCFWRDEEPLPKDEWCSEPLSCFGDYCHDQTFWDGYNRERDRIDSLKEQVIAYLDHVDADVKEAS